MLSTIEEVIYNIESYDTTSVRASIPNYLISKYIKKYEDKCDAKVIFNGDDDEVTGGYIYFHYIKNMLEFDKECRRLLKDIHYFDVLRSDRSISSNGLEARTPFLDRNFVQTFIYTIILDVILLINYVKNIYFEKHLMMVLHYQMKYYGEQKRHLVMVYQMIKKLGLKQLINLLNRLYFQMIVIILKKKI